MQTAQLPAIAVNGDLIPVTPMPEHEYVVPTALVAIGYGVKENTVRMHLQRHADELVEGKHWISSVTNSDAGNLERRATLWTKRGIVRLGFFIRSARAKQFRDLAEDLVIESNRRAATHRGPAGLGMNDVLDMVGDLVALNRKLATRLDVVEVEHRLLMQSMVREKGALPNDRRQGLPQHRTDGRSVTSPQNGRKGGRPPKLKKGLDFWLLANYKRDGRSRTRSRDIYEHYRKENPKAKETPVEMNRAIVRLFRLTKQRWMGKYYQEMGFIGLRRL